MKSLFEQLGGTYTRQGDYCLPDVCLPPEEERPIGVYGQRRRAYLKENHQVFIRMTFGFASLIQSAREKQLPRRIFELPSEWISIFVVASP